MTDTRALARTARTFTELGAEATKLLEYELARERISPSCLPRLAGPKGGDTIGVQFSTKPDAETRRVAWDVLVNTIVYKDKTDPIGWTEGERDGFYCIDLHWAA